MESFRRLLRISLPVLRSSWVSVAVLLVLTEAVYIGPSILWGGETLLGMDYSQLHIRRIAFAQSALFGANPFLPGWYPRELLGTPFSANLQSFPWIPTRLVLLLLDPTRAYAVAIAIAAALAAIFTYLYCRRAGISELGAVTAGWTFACAGFFATRVMAGHLPLLEAYPSLPLLLWLTDRAIAPDRAKYRARDLAALAIAGACVALAGHPQLPAYSLGAALLYVLWRGRGWRRVQVLSALALGVGTTLAAWWPMLLLISRSTRVLHLAAPSNDIAMPYRRFLALIIPGVDGWPDTISLGQRNPFNGYPHDGYFWDTASYIGLLPLLVILALLFWSVTNRRLPSSQWAFLAALGSGALLLSLPLMDPLRQIVPGTLLRSPARLLYLSTFAASVALGFGVNAILKGNAPGSRATQAMIGFCLLLHVIDLGGFARMFAASMPPEQAKPMSFEPILAQQLKDARIAADDELMSMYRDRYDDVGVFDSILLANPYRAILGLTGAPRDENEHRLDGSELAVPALQGAGVRFVVTTTERNDLDLVSSSEDEYLYRVPNPAPRAAFFAEDRIDFLPSQSVLDAFVSHPRQDRLLLPEEARTYIPGGRAAGTNEDHPDQSEVSYFRPSSDEIRLETVDGQAGFVQVLESHDPGWTAEVDGVRSPVAIANGFSMAVPVPAGKHTIRLRYRTPGRTSGCVLSLLSVCLLGSLIWTTWGRSGHIYEVDDLSI